MRVEPFDNLAVQFHHQPQHAVRRRMLWPEIDRVILDRDFARFGVDGGCRVAHFLPSGSAFSSPGST